MIKMKKTFCDRCGAEINGVAYALLTHKTVYAKQRLLPSYLQDGWKETEKYLCPNCERQYIHWFMNPESKGEE